MDSSGFLGRGQRGRSCAIIQEPLEEVWRSRTAVSLSLGSQSVVSFPGGALHVADAAYRAMTHSKACLIRAGCGLCPEGVVP